jgi:hypothetical protein
MKLDNQEFDENIEETIQRIYLNIEKIPTKVALQGILLCIDSLQEGLYTKYGDYKQNQSIFDFERNNNLEVY